MVASLLLAPVGGISAVKVHPVVLLQVAVDIVHHKTMYDLHHKVSPSEAIIGWFSTGPKISSSDALIQEFYTKECPSSSTPVHLTVDTSLAKEGLGVAAFVSRVLSLGDKTLGTEFVEVACEVLFADVEKVGVDLLLSGSSSTSKSLADQETLQTSIRRLQQLLATTRQYVDEVVAGTRQGDAAIGRYLADTLAVVPRLAASDFEVLFNESVQDALLVDYLAHLTRAQVALAERLGTSALPLL